MEEKKCLECGEVLAPESTLCRKCGCPVPRETPVAVKKAAESPIAAPAPAKAKFNIMSLVALLLGVVILILGIILINKKSDTPIYSAPSRDVSSAEFGADFYTYMYGASDTMVDELYDISRGISTLSDSTNYTIDAIYFSAGMIICALGLGTIAVACIKLKKEI